MAEGEESFKKFGHDAALLRPLAVGEASPCRRSPAQAEGGKFGLLLPGGRGKFVIDAQAPPAHVAVKSERAGAEMLKGTEVEKR
jgi:hypothetical protein